MNTTQDILNISEINNNLVLLKDGSLSLIMQTSAVNFGLLSEREQVAIIDSFAQMLNSLSFSIQVVIHSKRLDITSYIRRLDEARLSQTNPLLAEMMAKYRNFIKATIKENNVLDKNFYIIINVSSIELGLHLSSQQKIKKAQNILIPRRDQIARQLSRIGLKSRQLRSLELVRLLYDIYNQQAAGRTAKAIKVAPVVLSQPAQTAGQVTPVKPTPEMSVPPTSPPQPPQPPQTVAPPAPAATTQTSQWSIPARSNSRHHPFVVEELSDVV